ncbi:M56 family metallopeptidase [Metasolibacillus meyeri]|uniref:M56 family metallopeptidase n=1 Tax=Metasolibacillus meyeri TaxID=1071052 RepID=A0AAW9NNC1_9BACL|nr:M56 family metallopeptidase [Metasolibacillus meyeri]MEC1178950.1 M56 family metallopeptidase [Metasolibacillus meyeri]
MQSVIVGLLFKSVVMTIVGLIFMAVTPLFLKRYSAKWLYYGWLIILLGFILPFTFQTTTKVINLLEPAQILPKGMPPIQAPRETFISTSVETISVLSIWQVAMIIWILGILLFFVYHLVRHRRFTKMLKKWSQIVDDTDTIHLLEAIKDEMKIIRKVGIKECSFVHSPKLVGFINHTILLPNNEYSNEELKIILKHELVHLKRKDLWYKAFVMLVYSIHWFNPLFYLFVRELDKLCEYSCDEVVKNANIELRKTYSQTILYAEKYSRRASIFSTNFIGDSQSIKKRILSIMDTRKKKSGVIVIALLILLITCGFTVSSAFAISSKPMNYLDETFMKESILNGLTTGDFATEKLIIYPESMEMQRVSSEPDKNEELFMHNITKDIIAYEARYRYPIEIVHRNQGHKYTTLFYIEYDYELFEPIEYNELNRLIESYLLTAEDMFKSIMYTEFVDADYLYNQMQEYKKYVDEHNTDTRVEFTFNFMGMHTNLPILEGMDLYFYSTPRYLSSTP